MPTELHTCNIDKTYGDWRLTPITSNIVIRKSEITPLCKSSNLQTIAFDQISWKRNPDVNKRGANCSCCGGKRYTDCNTSFPGILCKDGPNPESKAYRMLDGKHRIEKMSDAGITSSKFYVLEYEQIKPFFIYV